MQLLVRKITTSAVRLSPQSENINAWVAVVTDSSTISAWVAVVMNSCTRSAWPVVATAVIIVFVLFLLPMPRVG
jgi:hypothetical protein